MRQSELDKRLNEYKKRSHLQESSEDVLGRAVRWFGELHEGIKPIAVNYGHADDFRSWLKKGRAGTTANTYLAMIGGFFSWMFRRGYIKTDPFDNIKRYSVVERQFEQYKPEEIERILRVADIYWRAIVCLALCSMRRAEILNLCVSEIDFEHNHIHIKPKSRTERTWPWHIKDHNEALVGIDDSIAKLLLELCEGLKGGGQPYVLLKPDRYKLNIDLQEAGELKHGLRNCPWGNFSRDFKKLLARARVRHKRFHSLRGTFATERYNAGFELIDLQYLMRHSSIQTTARYIKKVDGIKLIDKSSRTFNKYYAANVQ